MPESIEESKYIDEMNTGQQRVFYPLCKCMLCYYLVIFSL